jgi:LacI family transcriptional regulator
MPTITDVAKRAGVAPITVSRVINNSGYVAAGVRTRVEAAVVELGYVPNRLARSLRSRRTNTLALVLTDITNPFFTTVARGVEDAASDAGFMVMVCNTDERESEESKYLRLLLSHRVDGILLVPARGAEASATFVASQQTPLVILDRRAPGVAADVVRCDSVTGAGDLGRLLVSLGHERVAVLSGPEGTTTSDDRVRGFTEAFAAAGRDEPRVWRGVLTQDSGAAMTAEALRAEPAPTALFAVNNFLTIGALRGLRAAGRRVPEDVALVGFDDLPPALVTFPFLTVAAQPAYDMGRRAVELLLARIHGTETGPPQEIVLPTELVVRLSSGSPLATGAPRATP